LNDQERPTLGAMDERSARAPRFLRHVWAAQRSRNTILNFLRVGSSHMLGLHPSRHRFLEEVPMRLRAPRLGVLLAVVALAAFAVAGCGSSKKSSSSSSSGSSSTSTSTSTNAKVAAEVPAKIKSKGTLIVAEDASYAPNEFIGSDGKTVEGMDADLAKALAGVMGLKANVQNASFDGIIPGLASGKYDLGMSSFTDTKERQKTVDFVTYFSAGTSFYEKASGGPAISGLADLCGHKVAVEKGTTQADDSTAQGKKCKAAGKPGVSVSVFPDQNGANLAISSGRADIGMADSPVAAYQVKQSNGQFKLVGQTYGTAPYGIAIPKNNGMSKPVLDALKVLMSNGTYKSILQKWGIQAGAITNPVINGAIS
jgi:polar amino acid transport system substrate-binding protein